jgi:hypothetical protein
MKVTYGDGGWVRIEDDELPGPLFLRLEDDGTGRWRTKDVCLRGAWRSVVAADLRELNLAGFEEWLQTDVELIEGLSRLPAPQLDELAASFGVTRPQRTRSKVARLQRPTHGLTDDFLRHVAAAYREAVSDRKAPAPELARQLGDGATPRTIHKWVAVARQRGIMPPAARRKPRA